MSRAKSRINVLRSLSVLEGGSSFRVMRLFYTHAICSLMDYLAPYLVLGSPTLIYKLEVVQDQTLRLLLGAPVWTRLCTLRAECCLPTIHARVTQLSVEHYVSLLRRSPASTPAVFVALLTGGIYLL